MPEEAPNPHPPHALHRYVWLLPGIALGVLLTLLLGPTAAPIALAADSPTIGGGSGLYVAPARLGFDNQDRPVFGAYLIDTDAKRLAVYQVAPQVGDDPGEATVRLLAVRDTASDGGLRAFNSGSPDAREMQELLRMQDDARRAREARPVR